MELESQLYVRIVADDYCSDSMLAEECDWTGRWKVESYEGYERPTIPPTGPTSLKGTEPLQKKIMHCVYLERRKFGWWPWRGCEWVSEFSFKEKRRLITINECGE